MNVIRVFAARLNGYADLCEGPASQLLLQQQKYDICTTHQIPSL